MGSSMIGGYRVNAKPPIHIEKLPIWIRWNMQEVLVKFGIYLFCFALVAVTVLGTASLVQYVVTGIAGHPIGTYPVYCVGVFLFLVFRPTSK